MEPRNEVDAQADRWNGTRWIGPIESFELREENVALQQALDVSEASRKSLQDLYEQAPVGYITLDQNDCIIGANLTVIRLLQQPREKIIGSAFEVFLEEQHDAFANLIGHALKTGEPESIDLRLKRGDTGSFYAQLDYVRVESGDQPPSARITLIDITERKTLEGELERLAFYDHLTCLPNRRLLLDRLHRALLCCVQTQCYGAIFLTDLDGFKTLNETLGHDAGDLLLQEVAKRLLGSVSDTDTVARLGGDVFVVMLEGMNHDAAAAATEARAAGEKLLKVFNLPFQLANGQYECRASMGITLFKDNHESVRDLLTRADLALHRAKNEGRRTLRFVEPGKKATLMAKTLLDAEVRRALEENQFVLHYQPQVDQHGAVTGAEALLRWQHPTRGLIGPDQIIPFAEEKGLIGLVGQWVLKTACMQLLDWSRSPRTKDLKLAVNVSAHEFSHPDFVLRVLKALDTVGANPQNLVLELTETVMLGSMKETNVKMGLLKARGIRFSLDDFGIGYSSLSCLQRLPMDQLKIDRAFVSQVLSSQNDATIVNSIIALGNSLGIGVIAEGVETEEQRAFLASHGCRAYQGYLFGRPGNAQDVVTQSMP